MKKRIGLIQFPGSNCEKDCERALTHYLNCSVEKIWHQESKLPANLHALVIPGGFSYGDYIRSGVVASKAKIMTAVKEYAAKNGAIIGICNGFQILTESKLLPGALIKNAGGKFISKSVTLTDGQKRLSMPIAHGEGRYVYEEPPVVAYKYDVDVNGSMDQIAGIWSANKKILGLMPHPERAVDQLLGSDDGLEVWKNFFEVSL